MGAQKTIAPFQSGDIPLGGLRTDDIRRESVTFAVIQRPDFAVVASSSISTFPPVIPSASTFFQALV
jgi:hypothetical protein